MTKAEIERYFRLKFELVERGRLDPENKEPARQREYERLEDQWEAWEAWEAWEPDAERDEAREAARFLNSHLKRFTMNLEQPSIQKQWPWITDSRATPTRK